LSDGKILVGGYFTTFNGTGRNRIARLNSDGTLDTGFDPGTGFDNGVVTLTTQSDGKVLAGGYFSTFNGTSRVRIARLNTDGSLDTSFDPGTGANNYVNALFAYPDGKIVLVGKFTAYNGSAAYGIVGLLANGGIDTGFEANGGFDDENYVVLLQPDGKIIVGGYFNGFDQNLYVNSITRLELSAATSYNTVEFNYNGINYIGSY
jgi:uncharacterized delta-60 repeat protein